MPHLRQRHCLPILLKKLKFSPVVTIQGMRQTGKSVFVRELLSQHIKSLKYITLDRLSEKTFANTNPESFLSKHKDKGILAIDEAQKAPPLFDGVKLVVDEDRKPGMFILLGSTEFSKMTLIRESLTGRMSRVLLFPLNFAESLDLKANSSKSDFFLNENPRGSRKDLMRYLTRGGMPGIFAARDEGERLSLIEDWLQLTVERDLMQIPRVKFEPDLARRLLTAIAKIEEPSAGSLSKYVGASIAKVKNYLEALATLFVVQKVLPHPSGTGKPLYFLGDVSFATFFDASFERQLQTFALQEISSQISYRGETGVRLYYYRGSRGGRIDFVLERKNSLSALKILSTVSLDERELQVLLAWKKKEPKLSLFALGGLRTAIKDIEIFPWEALG